MKGPKTWKLTYSFGEVIGQLSMNPSDSDSMANQLIMDHLVGTLVKYGPSGRFEPYLAERWESLDDDKTWRFTLRPNLLCEDGSLITAPDFVYGFRRQLKAYGKSSSPLEFAKLQGWPEFNKGNSDALGIHAIDSQTIEFKFEKRPVSLLEFIRMAYFGYYCPENFSNDQWKDHRKIISSGSYRLAPWDGKGDLHLLRRDHWFSHRAGSPFQVTITKLANHDLKSAPTEKVIIGKKLSGLEKLPPSFLPVFGTPTILNSLVLSPYRKGLFDNAKNRRLFYDRFSNLKEKTPFASANSKVGKYFYPTAPSDVIQENSLPKSFENPPTQPLKIVVSSTLLEDEKAYISRLIETVFVGTGIQVEYHSENRSNPNWFDDLLGEKNYDIRVARVDIGGQLDSAGIRMMFCTTLGISFPDVKGQICKITDAFEAEQSGITAEKYAAAFNQTLYDDAVVLPIFHSGLSWLYSKDIDVSNINPSALYPRFDLTGLRE